MTIPQFDGDMSKQKQKPPERTTPRLGGGRLEKNHKHF